MINVTPTAATKITELLTEENKIDAGLRVFVQGGGCSGFQYGLMIDEGEGDATTDGDRVERRQAARRSDQRALPEGRRGRFRRQHHRRGLHHQESERQVHLRLRFVVQRLDSEPVSWLRMAAPADGQPAESRAVHGPTSRTSTASARRQQALRQARSHRQRVPPPGGAPHRRRSRRSHPARRPADQPRHRLPHAAVDGGGGHRPQGRFRRRPLPLRAFVSPSAPLSSHLQDLQPDRSSS